MKLSEIQKLLEATPCYGEEFYDSTEVRSACGADLMSDVLAFVKDGSVLMTGLVNPQVVRTAEMLDVMCIVFVRGKQPTEEIIEIARKQDIAIMSTALTMYCACGILYANGLPGTTRHG